MVYISRSRSRSVRTAPFTRATGLSLIWFAEGAGTEAAAGCAVIPLTAWDATCAAPDTASVVEIRIVKLRLVRMRLEILYFIIPRLLKKGERNSLPRCSCSAYWNCVTMLLVLL